MLMLRLRLRLRFEGVYVGLQQRSAEVAIRRMVDHLRSNFRRAQSSRKIQKDFFAAVLERSMRRIPQQGAQLGALRFEDPFPAWTALRNMSFDRVVPGRRSFSRDL